MRHPSLAGRDDTCLVVIDMQEPFLRAMFDLETVVRNTRRLLGVAKVLNLPVLVTLQNPEKMGDTVPEVKELLPDVRPFAKMSFSCCADESFVNAIADLHRGTVILCGIEAHICVSQTAHDLLAVGHRVHVPEDAVCSRKETNRRSGLEKMRQSGVIVTSTEAVIYELMECAGTDEFREVLKLVK